MAKCEAHAFKDTTHTLHLYFLFTAHFETLFENFLTQFKNAFNQRLWTRWAPRDVDIYGYDSINSLDGIVTIVEFTARVCTLSHTDDPFWVWHLLIEEAQAWTH